MNRPGSGLPRFMVRYPASREDASSREWPAEVKSLNGPAASFAWLRPEPTAIESDDKTVIVLGSPIYSGTLGREVVARRCLQAENPAALAGQINGSFLIVLYDRPSDTLTVVNDRFASIPFFYGRDEAGFVGSISYADLWLASGGPPRRSPLEESFYEFIHLQRLLGDKTYDSVTRYLTSSSILTCSSRDGRISVARYWRPVFEKDRRFGLDDFADELRDAVRRSAAERTADGRRYGLLLSGGLDSRAVLAALDTPATCFTIGDRENNEFRVAALVAGARDYPHVFVQRSASHYGDIVDDAVAVGGAMNVYDHAHFLDLGARVSDAADVMLHGHGFDYLFQGMYLPTKRVTLGGKRTYVDRLKAIKGRVAQEYIDGVKYRLKGIAPAEIVKPEHRSRMADSLRASVESVLNEGQDVCQDEYDLWEYMHVHNLSRHYTYLNVLSIRASVEERTVCFDNRIFDLYLRMPVKYRVSGRVLKRAIRLMNEELSRIVNANTNLPAGYGPLTATAARLGHGLTKKLGLRRTVPSPPTAEDRSWPSREALIRQSGSLRTRVQGLADSDRLASLSFLDMSKVRDYTDLHLTGAGDYGALLLTLLTVDRFLALADDRRSPAATAITAEGSSA